MASIANPDRSGAVQMSVYEAAVWDQLNRHWERRDNRRGLPNWAADPLRRTGSAVKTAGKRAVDAVPEKVRLRVEDIAGRAAEKVAAPAIDGAVSLLNLINDWVVELNDPRSVEKLARKRGVDISHFTELRERDLKSCDRLLTANTLKWRTFGAAEGGAMGVLALVPVAGIPIALTADLVVVQALSISIASRVAYSYGFDAKDPHEQEFIQRLVGRSFMAQAAKARPLGKAAQAANAAKGRIRWSPKFRADHPLLVAIEKLLQQMGPAGARVSVGSVAKVAPYIGIVIGAGFNAAILGGVAAEAKRYSQTRFLCEKYGMPMPAALSGLEDVSSPTPGD